MEINFKFKIGELVLQRMGVLTMESAAKKRIQKGESLPFVMEIVHQESQTCYGGTQLFYHCRPMAYRAENNFTPKFSEPELISLSEATPIIFEDDKK